MTAKGSPKRLLIRSSGDTFDFGGGGGGGRGQRQRRCPGPDAVAALTAAHDPARRR